MNGQANRANVKTDTETNRVLIGEVFIYWGGSGPDIPQRFRNWRGIDVCGVRHHRTHFPEDLKQAFVDWILSHEQRGFVGEPFDWAKSP